MTGPEPREVAVRGDMIRLGQLLKHAGLADSGGEARELLGSEAVTVGGEVETRRGRQLRDGDVVRVGDAAIVVRAAPAAS